MAFCHFRRIHEEKKQPISCITHTHTRNVRKDENYIVRGKNRSSALKKYIQSWLAADWLNANTVFRYYFFFVQRKKCSVCVCVENIERRRRKKGIWLFASVLEWTKKKRIEQRTKKEMGTVVMTTWLFAKKKREEFFGLLSTLIALFQLNQQHFLLSDKLFFCTFFFFALPLQHSRQRIRPGDIERAREQI